MGGLITERAMMARVTTGYWRAKATDKKIAREVARHYDADDNVADFRKALVAKAATDEYARAAENGRAEHDRLTTPFMDGGWRMLPSAALWEHQRAMEDAKQGFWTAVNRFLENYDYLKGQARATLGRLYREDDYPDVHRLETMFRFDVSILPIPSSGHLIVDLEEQAVADLRASVNASIVDAMDASQRDLWDRLYGAVSKMAERLEGERGPGKPKIFRDSLVTNVRDLCGLLPKLNVADDPDLERMRQEVEERLSGVEPEDLRKDERLRNDVAEDAKRLIQSMAGFMR